MSNRDEGEDPLPILALEFAAAFARQTATAAQQASGSDIFGRKRRALAAAEAARTAEVQAFIDVYDDQEEAIGQLEASSRRYRDSAALAVANAMHVEVLVSGAAEYSERFGILGVTSTPEPTHVIFETEDENSTQMVRSWKGVSAEMGSATYLDGLLANDLRVAAALTAYTQRADANPDIVSVIESGTIAIMYSLITARPDGKVDVTPFRFDRERVSLPKL